MAKSGSFSLLIAGFVGLLGLTLYPAVIAPMINPSEYKEIQKAARSNIKQDEIQPGNMKVWSDPFDRKKAQQE